MAGFSPDWWDLIPATVGALVGAAAAAWPAYTLARRSSAEVLERDRQARHEADMGAAYSVFSKLMLLANSLLTLQKQFEQMAARQADPAAPLSRRISAFAGLTEREIVAFDTEDFAYLARIDEIDYVNELQLLSRRQQAIIGALLDYRARKELAQSILDDADFVTNERGDATYKLTPEQARRLNAQELHLEAIVVPIRAQLTESAEHARRVADQLGPLLKRRYPGAKVPHLTDDLATQAPPA